uniref:NinB protein n=1 Tax=Myoviridae sp. cthAo37 TaxID=2827701 RepID=A0A8S5S5A2_9CAUD|nr:MAG TPA: NinB protein [Myoviridae sp. cthAo37]
MEVSGRFDAVSLTMEGGLKVTFLIADKEKALREIEAIKDAQELIITAKPHKAKRSLDANAYFWVLCDRIAKRLGSDKWTIYLLQLSKYGVFADLQIKTQALEILKEKFRYIEVLQEGEESCTVRCYFGSSIYNTKEMSDLIHGTVSDAESLGIDTITPEEMKNMLAIWKGSNNMKDY